MVYFNSTFTVLPSKYFAEFFMQQLKKKEVNSM